MKKPLRLAAAAEIEFKDEVKRYGAPFRRAVRAAFVWIRDRPRTWPVEPRYPGAQRFVLESYPFIVVYREMETEIRILAIAHTSREPGYWRDRR